MLSSSLTRTLDLHAQLEDIAPTSAADADRHEPASDSLKAMDAAAREQQLQELSALLQDPAFTAIVRRTFVQSPGGIGPCRCRPCTQAALHEERSQEQRPMPPPARFIPRNRRARHGSPPNGPSWFAAVARAAMEPISGPLETVQDERSDPCSGAV